VFRRKQSDREFIRELFAEYDKRMAAERAAWARERETVRRELLGVRPGQLQLFAERPPPG
jgi:hypothetical protein